MRSLFKSDKKAIHWVVHCPNFFNGDRLAQNVKLLVGEGVLESTIGYLFHTRATVLLSHDLGEAVDELKGLGFVVVMG